MKRLVLLGILCGLVAGCEDEPTEGESTGYGTVVVEAFDAPPPLGVERIDLTVREVSVHDTARGWITLAQPNETYNFLELINGETAVLAEDTVQSGYYTQLRLEVADSNTVTIQGETYPLFIPSGVETGVKLNLHFSVDADELVGIYVDFDASKSIKWTRGHEGYTMRPAFRAFKRILSATLAGTVRDTLEAGIANALVEAIAGTDTTSTLTDVGGAYQLVLLAGTYDLEASAEGYTAADTTYVGVQIEAGAVLTGYDFVLE